MQTMQRGEDGVPAKILKRILMGAEGGVLVFGAILLVPLMGLAAFAVDWGHFLQVRWILQNAVDAGVQSARAHSQTGGTWGEAWLKAMTGAYEITRENIRKNGIRDFRVWTEREGIQLKVYAEAPVDPLFARILGMRTVLVRASGQTTITPSVAVGPQETQEIPSLLTATSSLPREAAIREPFLERNLDIVPTAPGASPRANPSQGGFSQPQAPSISQETGGPNLQPSSSDSRTPQPPRMDTDDWAYPGSTFVFIQEQRDEQTSYLGLDRTTGEVQRLRGQVEKAYDFQFGSGTKNSTVESDWSME